MDNFKQSIMRRLAASHIAGPSVRDALAVCREVEARGWAMTICPWTDGGTSGGDALLLYREAVRAIAENRLDCRLSVKAPALGNDRATVMALVADAQAAGVYLHFDAHGPETADPAFRLVAEASSAYSRVGCTLPSRWRRSIEDARRIREEGLGVRLVKGQWSDPDIRTIDARKNFLAVARELRGSEGLVSVATHDARLASEALSILKASGTPCELELLFSLPLGILRVAQALELPVRIYTPYGHPYLPYNIMHVRTRPGIAFWALRNFLIGKSHPRF
jgi:proline dehydrogenase